MPHCQSVAEATGFEATTATSTSLVTSSNRPSPSSIRPHILLPFLSRCYRARLRPLELCHRRRPSRVSSSLRHLAWCHPAASPVPSVKTSSRTRRRRVRDSRATADGQGAVTTPQRAHATPAGMGRPGHFGCWARLVPHSRGPV
jgi:hypothetical protein